VRGERERGKERKRKRKRVRVSYYTVIKVHRAYPLGFCTWLWIDYFKKNM
jgi:hypothetical protein